MHSHSFLRLLSPFKSTEMPHLIKGSLLSAHSLCVLRCECPWLKLWQWQEHEQELQMDLVAGKSEPYKSRSMGILLL